MRITQAMITRNALIRVNQNRANMVKIQEHIVTGKIQNRASEDPTNFSRADRYRSTLRENEQYLTKIKSANSWIDNSVSLLEQMSEITLQARDIANKGADGQSDASIRAVMAGSAEALLSEMLSLTNSQYLGKNVFAGTDTKIPIPFDYSSGVVSYLGNGDAITRSYSQQVNVTVNTSGQEIMDTGIFVALTDLIVALNTNDEDGVRLQIDTLRTASEAMINLSSEMGARQRNVDLIQSRLEKSNIDISGFLSEVTDAKLEEEIVKFKAEEFAYQAAMQATSVAMRMTILDYF